MLATKDPTVNLSRLRLNLSFTDNPSKNHAKSTDTQLRSSLNLSDTQLTDQRGEGQIDLDDKNFPEFLGLTGTGGRSSVGAGRWSWGEQGERTWDTQDENGQIEQPGGVRGALDKAAQRGLVKKVLKSLDFQI